MPLFQTGGLPEAGFSEDTFGCPPRLPPALTPRSEVHSCTFNPLAHGFPISPLLIASPCRRDSRWDDDIKLFDPLELFKFKREGRTSEREMNEIKQEQEREAEKEVEREREIKREVQAGRKGVKVAKGSKGKGKVGKRKGVEKGRQRQTKIDQYWKVCTKKGGKG